MENVSFNIDFVAYSHAQGHKKQPTQPIRFANTVYVCWLCIVYWHQWSTRFTTKLRCFSQLRQLRQLRQPRHPRTHSAYRRILIFFSLSFSFDVYFSHAYRYFWLCQRVQSVWKCSFFIYFVWGIARLFLMIVVRVRTVYTWFARWFIHWYSLKALFHHLLWKIWNAQWTHEHDENEWRQWRQGNGCTLYVFYYDVIFFILLVCDWVLCS